MAPRLQVQRNTTGLTLAQMTLTELHTELIRRVTKLREERDQLVERIEQIDRELSSLPGLEPGDVVPPMPEGSSKTGRGAKGAATRRLNERPLREVLITVLATSPLTTRDAAEAAIAAGYKTSSNNFPNTVYVALHKDKRFHKESDGLWKVKEDAAG